MLTFPCNHISLESCLCCNTYQCTADRIVILENVFLKVNFYKDLTANWIVL